MKTQKEIKDQIILIKKEEKESEDFLKKGGKGGGRFLERLGHQIKICETTYKIKALEWALGKHKNC